jgi:hypothetical protein
MFIFDDDVYQKHFSFPVSRRLFIYYIYLYYNVLIYQSEALNSYILLKIKNSERTKAPYIVASNPSIYSRNAMSSITNSTIIDSPVPYSRTIIFYIFIVLLIPSVACSLLIFYYFIRLPQLRQQPTNHIILALLIVLFIEVSCHCSKYY